MLAGTRTRSYEAGSFLSSLDLFILLLAIVRAQKPIRLLGSGLYSLQPSHSSCPPVAELQDCATRPGHTNTNTKIFAVIIPVRLPYEQAFSLTKNIGYELGVASSAV